MLQPRLTQADGAPYTELYDGNPEIETVSIGGPYDAGGPGDTPSRQKLFVCHPARAAEERACATRILSNLARRAYRRPATEGDVETLLAFYESGRKQGGFDAGIQSALTRTLVDPEFLFRIERDPVNRTPGTVYPLDDLAIASRLSFFLWSSIPDDELLDLAIAGKLRDPAVLQQQVRRMFADARSDALIDNFAQPVAQPARTSGSGTRPRQVPRFRREPPRGVSAGDGIVPEKRASGGSQRGGVVERELYVCQRAARTALPDPEYLWRCLSTSDVRQWPNAEVC